MERLTIKNNDGSYSQPTKTTFEKLFYKVAEFEDFMESFGFEELEQLEHELGYVHWNKIEKKSEFITHKYNAQKLKDRWNKLKEWIFNTKPLRGASVCFLQETLLEKMEELEKGEL